MECRDYENKLVKKKTIKLKALKEYLDSLPEEMLEYELGWENDSYGRGTYSEPKDVLEVVLEEKLVLV